MRLAFARINQETNCLSPVFTTRADFERDHYVAGDKLLRACLPDETECEGMFKNAELSGFVQAAKKAGAQVVPLMSAWSVPGGPLTRECFESLTGELIDRVRASLPVDGVYLCLHGALGVEGIEEPEAEITKRVRKLVGPDVPIVVSLDLHGNVTRGLVDASNAIVAYTTNPHRDHARIGARCARILFDAVAKKLQPTMAWRSLPMLLGGGTTLDFAPPLLSIFMRMRALERRGEVLSASVLTCHPWNAHPELGWSVVVVTDGDQAKAERIADELAEKCWGTRNDLPPKFVTPDEAIAKARAASLRRKLGTVVLADASDVVSAGAPGENTALLRALCEQGQGLLSYVPLRDPSAIEELWTKNVGERVRVTLGGKLDPKRGQSFDVDAEIINKTRSHAVERIVVLGIGTVRVVVVEGPALAIKPAFFKNAGLDPWKADVVVVKNFFPFRMYFLPLARLTLYVRTSGVTDFDAAFHLPFAGPVHPRDPVSDWRDADRRRRAA
jgi:microcystin degradation protein MlrC